MFTDALYFYGIFVQTLGKFMAVNFGKSDKKNRKKTTDTYSLKRFQKWIFVWKIMLGLFHPANSLVATQNENMKSH